MLQYEEKYLKEGKSIIAGVDEAGRGPLAGPVVVASVIMPLGENDIIEGVNDSKKLSPKLREFLYDKIIEKCFAYKISVINEKEIDRINILNATKIGMKECVEGLDIEPDIVLIDAVKKVDIKIEFEPIIKGDAKSYSIAAASILAKVYRDRLMIELDKLYPQYLFAKHKGYATKLHIELLKKYGKCDMHRDSFIKNFVGGNEN